MTGLVGTDRRLVVVALGKPAFRQVIHPRLSALSAVYLEFLRTSLRLNNSSPGRRAVVQENFSSDHWLDDGRVQSTMKTNIKIFWRKVHSFFQKMKKRPAVCPVS